jgi:hypothetical protein
MEDSFAFEMLDEFEDLGRRAPTQWVARYDPPTQSKPDLRFVTPMRFIYRLVSF